MSPKTRVQILLEPDQLAALRRIQARTLAPVGAQIRQAVDTWLASQGEKTDRRRPVKRRRS